MKRNYEDLNNLPKKLREQSTTPLPSAPEELGFTGDIETRVYGIDPDKFDGKIFELSNNDFITIAEEQGNVWSLPNFEGAYNGEEVEGLFIRIIQPPIFDEAKNMYEALKMFVTVLEPLAYNPVHSAQMEKAKSILSRISSK